MVLPYFLIQNVPFVCILFYSIILLLYLQPIKYKNIHIGLLLVLVFCFFDFYIFFENFIKIQNNNLLLFKKNQLTQISCFGFTTNLSYIYLKFYINIKESLLSTNNTTSLFEKTIIYTKYLQEIYSYDLQFAVFV